MWGVDLTDGFAARITRLLAGRLHPEGVLLTFTVLRPEGTAGVRVRTPAATAAVRAGSMR